MNVNFELYRIFYVVAINKNMSKASEELFISQPAVSQSIKKLEEQLGASLFLRSNKGLELTKEGRNFFDYIKGAIDLIKSGENEFENFKQLRVGEVRIGASTTLTKLVLIDAIKNFKKDYPNIKISIINDLTQNLILDLKKGKLDFVVYNEDETLEDGIKKTLLKQLEYAFVYHKNYYQFNDIITLKEINNYPLILQMPKSHTRKLLDDFCLKHSVKLKPEFEVVSGELVKDLVKSGLGIGFILKALMEDELLKEIELKEKLPKAQVYLALHNNIALTFASKMFIKYLK